MNRGTSCAKEEGWFLLLPFQHAHCEIAKMYQRATEAHVRNQRNHGKRTRRTDRSGRRSSRGKDREASAREERGRRGEAEE